MTTSKKQIFQALRDLNNRKPNVKTEYYADLKVWNSERIKAGRYKKEIDLLIDELEKAKSFYSATMLTATFDVVFGGDMQLVQAKPKAKIKIEFDAYPTKPLNKFYAIKSYCDYLLLTKS